MVHPNATYTIDLTQFFTEQVSGYEVVEYTDGDFSLRLTMGVDFIGDNNERRLYTVSALLSRNNQTIATGGYSWVTTDNLPYINVYIVELPNSQLAIAIQAYGGSSLQAKQLSFPIPEDVWYIDGSERPVFVVFAQHITDSASLDFTFNYNPPIYEPTVTEYVWASSLVQETLVTDDASWNDLLNQAIVEFTKEYQVNIYDQATGALKASYGFDGVETAAVTIERLEVGLRIDLAATSLPASTATIALASLDVPVDFVHPRIAVGDIVEVKSWWSSIDPNLTPPETTRTFGRFVVSKVVLNKIDNTLSIECEDVFARLEDVKLQYGVRWPWGNEYSEAVLDGQFTDKMRVCGIPLYAGDRAAVACSFRDAALTLCADVSPMLMADVPAWTQALFVPITVQTAGKTAREILALICNAWNMKWYWDADGKAVLVGGQLPASEGVS